MQAFCRVHRIGQTRETFITRFTVKDTVDDRLIKMQEEKKIIISDTIDNRSLLKHLTVEELMSLFGTVAYDEDRKPFILVDDELDLRLKKKKKGGSNKGSKGGGKGKGKATTAQEGQDGGDADTQDGGTEDGDTQDGGTEQQEEEES